MTYKTDSKGLGILLQVAFKGAIDASPDPAPEAIYGLAKSYFKVLTALGEEFGVEFTGARSGGGGGGGNWKGGSATATRAPSAKSQAAKYDIDYFGDGKLITFADQRPLKASGQYKATAPDFSSIDKFDLGRDEPTFIPIWLVDRNGEFNAEMAEKLEAAGVDLTLPNEPVAATVTTANAADAVPVSRF